MNPLNTAEYSFNITGSYLKYNLNIFHFKIIFHLKNGKYKANISCIVNNWTTALEHGGQARRPTELLT